MAYNVIRMKTEQSLDGFCGFLAGCFHRLTDRLLCFLHFGDKFNQLEKLIFCKQEINSILIVFFVVAFFFNLVFFCLSVLIILEVIEDFLKNLCHITFWFVIQSLVTLVPRFISCLSTMNIH